MNKRKVKVVFVTFFVFLMSGCQFFSDYVFINQSGENVRIEYKIRREYLRVPKGTELKNYGRSGIEWDQIEAKTSQDSNGVTTINLEIPNDYILRITSSDIRDSKDDPEKYLGVTELKIEGKRGTQILSGDQVFKQFVENVRGGWIFPRVPEYTFRYK